MKQRESERPSPFSRAITRAAEWFLDRQEDLIPILMLGHLLHLLGRDDGDRLSRRLDELEEFHGLMFESNSFDWILAEGTVRFRPEKGHDGPRWGEKLLGRGGVILDFEERGWLEALAEAPLRVYEVVDCKPGEWVVFRDVLTNEEQRVIEGSGTEDMSEGIIVATRIVHAPSEDLPRLNGLFHFQRPAYLSFRRDLVRVSKTGRKAGRPQRMSDLIWTAWLRAYIPEVRAMVDQSSGEELLLTTHHYEVGDWSALERALDADSRCVGSRERSWSLLEEGTGQEEESRRRVIAGINPDERGGDRLGVFAQTRSKADEAKDWLEVRAGNAVRFVTTELVDPHQALAAFEDAPQGMPKSPLDDMEPAEVTRFMQTVFEEQYGKFMDQPIPFLDDQTPRQAIQTKAGRVEVEELVRSYEVGEQEQARSEGREPVSYEFLWSQIRE